MRARAGGLAFSMVLAACGGGDADEPGTLRDVEESERGGGTVVVASGVDLTTLNPAAAVDFLDVQVQRHVLLTTLLGVERDGSPRPYLAERWEVNKDTTQVTFHLRDDVIWHDGTPTTARDVEFTFNLLKDPDAAFPNREWFDQWEAAEVEDDRTIRFALRKHAGFLHGWMHLPIMPRHVFVDVPASEVSTHPFGTSEPVGNGPFRFVQRVPGDRWIFEANPDFPAELGRPRVERLVYRAIVDEATLIAELRAGDVRFAYDISPEQLTRLDADPDVVVATVPGRGYAAIVWNGQRAAFSDPAVRRALTTAIDRDALVAAVRHGLGIVANGPIGPWHWAHDESLEPLPYAPDRAGSELASAGWVDSDGDGTRDRGGEEFEFALSISERPGYSDIAQIVQSQLAQVGVDMSIDVQEASSLGAAITSPERRFDAVLLVWEPDQEVDDRQLFACAQMGEVYQFASYCNRELEPVLDSIPLVVDRTQRGRLYRTYQRTLAHDQPFSFLYFLTDASAFRRGLMGVELDPRGPLAGVTDWWIHPDRRTP